MKESETVFPFPHSFTFGAGNHLHICAAVHHIPVAKHMSGATYVRTHASTAPSPTELYELLA